MVQQIINPGLRKDCVSLFKLRYPGSSSVRFTVRPVRPRLRERHCPLGAPKEPYMDLGPLTTAVAATADSFDIELADTAAQRYEAFQVRHQVYCIERGYEPGSGGIETDEFDPNARHVLLRHREGGEVIGTVRLVMPNARRPHESFPMQRVCGPSALEALPLATTGEVSRFALSKERRHGVEQAGGLMRLALVQGLIQASDEEGLTHWCAVMERSLLRLLRMSAIHFQANGPMVEHHGLRQPAACDINVMLSRNRQEQPAVWDYLTEGGRLWTSRGCTSNPMRKNPPVDLVARTCRVALEAGLP